MENFNKMNKYLSNLALLNSKLHNLHWNVVGQQFMQVHQFTEALYDDFFVKYDDVAELMKMKGEMPLVKLNDYLENASIKEVDADQFSSVEVLEIVEADLKEMKALATEIRNEADAADDFEIVGEFEAHVASYSKNLWFIRAILSK